TRSSTRRSAATTEARMPSADGPQTALLAVGQLDEGNVTGLLHRLRYLARTKESRFDGAEIPRGAFRVGAGQAAVAVARPAVEGLLVAPALLLGRAHRRHREGTPERFGREGA